MKQRLVYLLVVLAVGSCAAISGEEPDRESAEPIGGYQSFSGVIDGSEKFEGQSWFDARDGTRGLCARIGEVWCRASYSDGRATVDKPAEFFCEDGREGIAKPLYRFVDGRSSAYAASIEVSDGSKGFASIFPVQKWYGENLCVE